MSIARCPVFVTTNTIDGNPNIHGVYCVKEDRIILKSGYSKSVFAHEVTHSYMKVSSSTIGSDIFEEECIADIGAYYLSKAINFSFDWNMVLHFRSVFHEYAKANNNVVLLSLKAALRLNYMNYSVNEDEIVCLINELLTM